MKDPQNFREERLQMVRDQLAGRGIRDERLLDVMRQVPRHAFVPKAYRHLSYVDGPLPIGEGQTISQPYIVALMTELLELKGDEVVLEIGTGSGYQAAVLGGMAARVYSIERHAGLARQAQTALESVAIENVIVIVGDGSHGLAKFAPYQGIIVTAAAPRVPQPLFDQLAGGGRLVVPVGGVMGQHLQVWTRQGARFERRDVVPVAFVPLRGEFGWSRQDWEDR